MKIKNQGQTTVEYLLLILVVVVFINLFMKTGIYKRFFGQGNELATKTKAFLETTYRHTRVQGNGTSDYGGYTGRHESYVGTDTRFFIPLEEYPRKQ